MLKIFECAIIFENKITYYRKEQRMKKILGIVIAMQSEADVLLEIAKIKKSYTYCEKQIIEGKFHGKNFALIISGVGKVNSAIAAQIILDKYSPYAILNFGVAGGVSAKTHVLDVFSISHAVQYDFDLVQLNNTPLGTLNEYEERYLPLSILPLDYPVAKLATGDRFNDSATDHEIITRDMQADIRDMEGAAIVQTVIKSKIPLYSVKAISDVAGSSSTTEQYLANLSKALKKLQGELKKIFRAL